MTSGFRYKALWYDHDFKVLGSRLVVNNQTFTVIVSMLSIMTGLLVPHVFEVIKKLTRGRVRLPSEDTAPESQGDTETELQVLRPGTTYSSINANETPREAVESSMTIESAILNLLANLFSTLKPAPNHGPSSKVLAHRIGERLWANAPKVLQTIGYIFVFTSVFVGSFVAGTWGAPALKLGSLVVPMSRDCGVWGADLDVIESGKEPVMDRLNETGFVRESLNRIHDYVDACYASDGDSGLERPDKICNYVAHRNVTYRESHDTDCPFRNNTTCSLGANKSYTLDTGWQSVSVLGINTRHRFTFRRRIRATPISTEGRYKRYLPVNETKQVTEYYLGPIVRFWRNESGVLQHDITSNYTQQNLFDDDGRSFVYRPYSSFPSIGDSNWLPLPIFNLDDQDDTLTVALVTGGYKCVYTKPQRDPIYPALKELTHISAPGIFSRGTVLGTALAVAERIELCDEKRTKCWKSFFFPSEDFMAGFDREAQSVIDMTFVALKRSTALIYFIGNHERKVANLNVRDGVVTKIADDLWKQETREAFEFTLARTQLSVLDIATGKFAHRPRFSQRLNPRERESICNVSVKLQAADMTNIHLPGLILYCLTLIVLGLVSFLIENPYIQVYVTGLFKLLLIFIYQVCGNINAASKVVVGFVTRVRTTRIFWTRR